nr:nuclear transport factor 2 family protein [Streptomyces coryli]
MTGGQWRDVEAQCAQAEAWRPEPRQTSPAASSEHPNCATIRAVYRDLTRIAEYAADDVVYHVAARDTPEGAPDLHGKHAVTAVERWLADKTGGTLRAEVESVVANDHWGTIIGTFHFTIRGEEHAERFCGLWKFRDGLITHHWQNAYDPVALGRLLDPPAQ